MRTRSTTSSVSVCSSTSTASYDRDLRAGVESYSIKRLEELIGFERNIDLEDATENLIAFESALDEGEAAEDLETRRSSPATTKTTAEPRWPCVTGSRHGELSSRRR